MDISPFLIIPEEIRGKIFNLIPQNESVNLRLVCTTWNQEIQNNYDYDIENLDEDSPYFKSMLQLRIKKLKVHRLETTSIFNSNLTSIFKRPNSIRSLIIKKSVPIPQLNLQLLIGHFSENLQYLQINVSVQICNYRFPTDLRYDLKHLKSLVIKSKDDGQDLSSVITNKCDDNTRSLFQVFENSSFPKLLHLDINLLSLGMTVEAKGRIVGNILRLLIKQGRFLTKLSLVISPYRNSILTELPVPIKEEELLCMKQINTINSFLVSVEQVGLVSKQFWKEFLFQQKQLIELSLFHTLDTYRLAKQILLNHSATLKLMALELNIFSTDSSFDLLIFKSCVSLNQLQLINNVLSNITEPGVKNLHCLPEQISKLTLKNLKILSEELLIAFQCNDTGTKGFKNLEKLNLVNCGSQGPFGVNAVVLFQIMMTPRPSLINVDFSRTIHQGEASLTLVLGQLKISVDVDFKLKRESGNDGCEGWAVY